ncbi:phosphate ABC transporter permease PstA [Haloarculaceae archaeon H-GB2-1]|nr:phosphate ABC transporter permease PstA [Haloarculaceae archaeon H-GB1-1]MEA5407858.1 phosphate ABC transporter permease PstA [Haloarculaceae archaeon H-GB2-1]
MSEGYATENALVQEESDLYDRGLDAAIALTVVSFVLGMITLVKVVGLATSGGALTNFFVTLLAVVIGGVGVVGVFSWAGVIDITSQRVRGIALGGIVDLVVLTALVTVLDVTLATVLGLLLVAQAAIVALAGLASRFELVDTAPNMSAGLLAGGAFGALGLLVGAAVGGTLVGFDSMLWILVALAVGAGLLILTILPREDVGSTLPTALLVGLLGLVVATATIGVGWEWNPNALSGGFTGGAVIPTFVLFGSLLSNWAAAKCRAGFGAPGRQYGAFFVINLNAFMMVSVMATIVVFVTVKGIGYAFHGFTIGAPAALVVLLPLLVLAVNWARKPAGTDAWRTGARQLVRVLPLALVGSLAAVVASVSIRGSALTYPFTYTVQVNRQPKVLDTGISVTPDPTVGALLLTFSALLLFAYFGRAYGTLRGVGRDPSWVDTVKQGVALSVAAMAVLTVVFAVLSPSPFGLPLGGTVGLVVVVLGAVVAGGLSVAAVATPLRGGAGTSLGEGLHDYAQTVVIGLSGALALLTAVVFLEPTAGVNPSVGPADLVPIVALLTAVASVGVSVSAGHARRSAAELRRRVLGEEAVFGLATAAGALALLGVHVAATGANFTVVGLTVGTKGSFSWPMTMQSYVPLGAEPGGILPAIVGTVWLVVGATLFAVPLGVGAAVFLTEYAEQGAFTSLVEIATNALWSTPSVVFGLFGAAFLIPRLGGDRSLLAGMLVLGFMLLPLVLITSREAILAVPDEYRDASAALGVTKWETIRSVVLPAAMPGVITGVILGVGRIAGETAPLILVLGSTLNSSEPIAVLDGFTFTAAPPFVGNPALLAETASLPTQIWAVIAAGVSGSPSMGWATAFILLMVVLAFYAVGIVSRTFFRRKLNYE